MHGERRGVGPGREVDGLPLRRLQSPADLRGEHVVVPPLPAQRLAEPQLGQAVTVHRGGVVEADAGVPGGLDHRQRRLLGDLAKDVSDGRGAEAEGRDLQVDAADRLRWSCVMAACPPVYKYWLVISHTLHRSMGWSRRPGARASAGLRSAMARQTRSEVAACRSARRERRERVETAASRGARDSSARLLLRASGSCGGWGLWRPRSVQIAARGARIKKLAGIGWPAQTTQAMA
jgi:hypothetical protein